MSISPVQFETKTLLDFTTPCSQASIFRQLQWCQIEKGRKSHSPKQVVFFDNYIKVGGFHIKIVMPGLQNPIDDKQSLSGWNFYIAIWDKPRPNFLPIDLVADPRFCGQEWITRNDFGRFSLSDLTAAIMHCQRLSRMAWAE
jgi:hypothetical protein